MPYYNLSFSELLLLLFVNLIYTLIVLVLPFAIYRGIKKTPMSPKRAKRIGKIYMLVYCILHIALAFILASCGVEVDGKEAVPNFIAIMLWYTVDVKILTKGYYGNEEEQRLKNNAKNILRRKAAFTISQHTNDIIPEPSYAIKSSDASKRVKKLSLSLFTNIASIVLSAVSILDIILALNLQDEDRNYHEHWNTTTVYFILLSLFCIFLLFSILSLKKRIFKILHPISYSLIIATVIVAIEKSVFSHGYYRNKLPRPYSNNDLIDIFNTIWIIGAILIFIITLLPILIKVAKCIAERRHKSIGYREKCYKRVAKMHRYLESGIITEEEYTSVKNDIMKNIK